jgi:hypothetical protein
VRIVRLRFRESFDVEVTDAAEFPIRPARGPAHYFDTVVPFRPSKCEHSLQRQLAENRADKP